MLLSMFLLPSSILILTLLPLSLSISPSSLLMLFTLLMVVSLSSFSLDYFSVVSFIMDDVSLLLGYITLLVIFVCYIISMSSCASTSYQSSLYLLTLSSLMVFSTSSFLSLYIFYESSLLPIIYLILKWGSYPDRDTSALSMLLFTSILTFPFSVLLMSVFTSSGSLHVFFLSFSHYDSLFFSLWIILSFAVKLPVYGLHFWLPQAHVEAPTFGSMILAGILLKMGSCGLLRLFYILSSSLPSFSLLTPSYLLVGTLLSCLLCCTQSDFKRLVAYSSVVHMTLVFLLLLTPTPVSYKAILFLSVFHGFSSPVLFLLVGVYYDTFSSRLILMLRGILLATPLLTLFATFVFLLNIPVPPFPSFFIEIVMFFSLFQLSNLMSFFILILSFLVLVYSLLWFVGSVFSPMAQFMSPSPLSFNTSLSFFSLLTPAFTFILIMSIF